MMSFKRTTRNNTTDMDPCERLLTEISAKMSTVCEKLQVVSRNIEDLTENFKYQEDVVRIFNAA